MPQRPESLAQVMVDADLAKSAARALQSPKARGGCCDPATLGAVASFFGDAWLAISAWPVPGDGGCTVMERSDGVADLGMALRRAGG